jgi:GNAT superfamily N-acetyltransferase
LPARTDVKIGIVDGESTRELRRSVLRPQLRVGDPLPGDERPGVVHMGATTAAGVVVSTGLVFPEDCPWQPGPAWHLRQMATEPAERGHGLGGAVLAAVVDYVADQGGGVLWCDARELAVAMYKRGGLIGEGELFTDEVHTIPHLRMWRLVAAR